MATPATEQLALPLDFDALVERATAYALAHATAYVEELRAATTRVWLEPYGVWAEGRDEWAICFSGAEENMALLEEYPEYEEHAHELAAQEIKRRRPTPPPLPPLRSLRTDLAPVPRLTQHRASNGRPRTARRARATARAPGGDDPPEPDLARPQREALTPRERAELRDAIRREQLRRLYGRCWYATVEKDEQVRGA